MSNKGKKKSVKVMSLSEFHSATPLPQESASAQPSLNWADEMEKLDDTKSDAKPVDFTFDRSQLPTATKAALEPDIDLTQVPTKPPFTAHLSNISFEADENKVRNFFTGCNILNLRLPVDERGTFKGHGFIDFAERESLIAALKKNGTLFCNRQIRVQLESDQRKHQRSQKDFTELRSDEADWRRPQQQDEESQPTRSYGEQRGNNRFGQQRRGGHQQGGYHQRDQGQREQYQGQRDQYQGQRDQYQGQRDQYQSQRGQYQREDHQGQGQGYQRRQFSSYNRQHRTSGASESTDQPADVQSVSSSSSTPTTSMTERPKLHLAPRTLPVEEVKAETAGSSTSIFGSAKPVNTAAREREIEEKLKKDRLEAERLEKERREKENEEKAKHEHEHEQAEPAEEAANVEGEFQVVGSSGKPRPQQQHQQPQPQQQHKNDNNNNSIRNQNRTAPYTSPPQRHNKKPEPTTTAQPAETQKENAWKTRPAADLFNKEPSAPPTETIEAPHRAFRPQGEEQNRRSHPQKRPENQNRDRPNRDGNNRDNKDRRFTDRNKPLNKNPRGERQFEAKPVRPRGEGFAAVEQPSANKNDLGFVNKFSKLAVDVDDPEQEE